MDYELLKDKLGALLDHNEIMIDCVITCVKESLSPARTNEGTGKQGDESYWWKEYEGKEIYKTLVDRNIAKIAEELFPSICAFFQSYEEARQCVLKIVIMGYSKLSPARSEVDEKLKKEILSQLHWANTHGSRCDETIRRVEQCNIL